MYLQLPRAHVRSKEWFYHQQRIFYYPSEQLRQSQLWSCVECNRPSDYITKTSTVELYIKFSLKCSFLPHQASLSSLPPLPPSSQPTTHPQPTLTTTPLTNNCPNAAQTHTNPPPPPYATQTPSGPSSSTNPSSRPAKRQYPPMAIPGCGLLGSRRRCWDAGKRRLRGRS